MCACVFVYEKVQSLQPLVVYLWTNVLYATTQRDKNNNRNKLNKNIVEGLEC